jgi:DNA-binding protein H-NS
MATSGSPRIDFDAMTVDDLWQMHEKLSHMLLSRMTSEKQKLEKRLVQLRREKAIGPLANGEAAPPRRERRKYPRVYPKYQNPEEPSETWSGRGKQPRWLTAALRTGHKIEEFVIRKSDQDRSSSTQRR